MVANCSLPAPAVPNVLESCSGLAVPTELIVAVSGVAPPIVIVSPATRLLASATLIVVAPALAAAMSVVLTGGPAEALRAVATAPFAPAVSVVACGPSRWR